jgi:Protein of unknown function (DUF3572)
MKISDAVEIAQDALIWLAGRPEDLARFLAYGGAYAEDLRDRSGDPEFLGFVLDFLLESEAAILAFTAAADLPPGAPALARQALPGGDAPGWT